MGPLRPRDWRWQRVEQLYIKYKASGRKSAGFTKLDDDEVRRGFRFFVAHERYLDAINAKNRDSAPAAMKLHKEWPDLFSAFTISERRTFLRWAVESMILTGATPAEIAVDIGCEPAVIAAYETFFYDVRDRLNNQLYIINELLSPAAMDGYATNDCDFFWKGLGYWYGPNILKAFWTFEVLPDCVRKNIQNLIDAQVSRGTARALLVRSPNQFNAHEIMEEHVAIKSISDEEDASTPEGQMAAGAAVMLQALQFSLAATKDSNVPAATEPRLRDTVAELAGEEVKELPAPVMKKRQVAKDAIELAKSLKPGSTATKLPEVDMLPDAQQKRAEVARVDRERKKNLILSRIHAKTGRKGK